MQVLTSAGPLASPVAIQEITNQKNLHLLVYLRWFAVVGQIAAIGFVYLYLQLDLPILDMGCVIAFLVGLNLVTIMRSRVPLVVSNLELLVELLLDVSALTVQLYLSGGATNPFVTLFLLQAILGAVLLRPWATWTVVAVTAAAYVGLMSLYRDIGLSMDMSDHGHPEFYRLHIYGMFICFLIAAILLVLLVTRITGNLRGQDLHLAELRQQSAEEGHIIRMGLLASGAAHELGTPLSTISVILNDWQHMTALRQEPDLAGDLAEVQAELARCKQIVSGILRSSGEERGEGAGRDSLIRFFDTIVADWKQRRDPARLAYENRLTADTTIVSDGLLRQVITNVLDNALEAPASEIGVVVAQDGGSLRVEIRDNGPGFPNQVLADLGRPYQSTKGNPGRGLGLFLVVNVLRKLGGRVAAANGAGGGAIVALTVPLAALSVETRHGV